MHGHSQGRVTTRQQLLVFIFLSQDFQNHFALKVFSNFLLKKIESGRLVIPRNLHRKFHLMFQSV